MRDKKRCIPQFAFYDKAGIQEYLERQAKEGWMLQKISVNWVFRRIEPKKIHFFVSYFPKKSVFEAEGSEEQRLFWDFCEHAGWKLAATNEQMQIFYNENENPVPIETDAAMEVEKVHRSAKKSYVSTYILLLVSWLLQLGMNLQRLRRDPLGTLADNSVLFLLLAGTLLAIYVIREIVRYFLWYKKARRAAEEEGRFVPARAIGKVWSVIPYAAIFCILLEMIFLSDSRMTRAFFCVLAAVILYAALIVGVSGWMKRRRMPAAVNRLTVVVLGVLLCIAMVHGIFVMVIRGTFSGGGKAQTYEYNGRTYEALRDELPLTVGDLLRGEDGGDSPERYSCELTEKESLLLARTEARQVPRRDAGNLPEMRYTVTEIKLPFLYDWCLEVLKDSYSYSREFDGKLSYHELRGTDAAPWGADAAYRAYWDGEAEREYVVCYGNVIVELNTEWEMTEEQMAVAGEKLVKAMRNGQ